MKFVKFFDPKKEIDFVGKFPRAMMLNAAIPLISLLGISVLGINWGIDFVGGTEMQVKFDKDIPAQEIRDVLASINFDKNQVQTYGAVENHEMLIRVERLSAIKASDVKNFKALLLQHFSLSDGDESFSVSINENAGDRIKVSLPLPQIKSPDDLIMLKNALNTQQASLAQALDTNSGFKLRRTKEVGETKTNFDNAIIRSEPENGKVSYVVQFMGISDKISAALTKKFGKVVVRRTEFVDSQVSKQLRTDGALAVIYALLAIMIYIAIRFDILFSPGAIVALLHDTMGALLVFVIGRFEFDLPSIAALLTIVGYSINNTIVIYDRIREIMPYNPKKPLSDEQVGTYVNKAINETLSRTINTSLTTLFASVSIWLLAGGVIRSFGLVLSVGIIFGAFSSMFAAPATYLFLRRRFSNKQKEGESATGTTGHSREDRARGVV